MPATRRAKPNKPPKLATAPPQRQRAAAISTVAASTAVLAASLLLSRPGEACAVLCRAPSQSTVSELLPIDAAFLSECWQRQVCYREPSPRRAEHAATLAAVFRAFNGGDMPGVRVTSRASKKRCTGGPCAAFTKIAHTLESALPMAVAIKAWLEQQLGQPFTLNAYLHPARGQHPDAEPICAHSDAQELLLVQLQGCRRWIIWDERPRGHVTWPFENERHEQCFAGGCDAIREHAALWGIKTRAYEMRAGSFLYLPWRNNTVHQTAPCGDGEHSENERSLHLTSAAPGLPNAAASMIFRALQLHLGETKPSELSAAGKALDGAVERDDVLGEALRASVSRDAVTRGALLGVVSGEARRLVELLRELAQSDADLVRLSRDGLPGVERELVRVLTGVQDESGRAVSNAWHTLGASRPASDCECSSFWHRRSHLAFTEGWW